MGTWGEDAHSQDGEQSTTRSMGLQDSLEILDSCFLYPSASRSFRCSWSLYSLAWRWTSFSFLPTSSLSVPSSSSSSTSSPTDVRTVDFESPPAAKASQTIKYAW